MKSIKKNISIEKLHPFEGHPYKVKDDEEMEQLTESIRGCGILSPIIVRPKENTTEEYEVISGHRRLFAAGKAGLKTVPAFIYAIDRSQAAIALVDSNLHRENILPSEKAFAYKLKMNAMKHQGERTDLETSDQVGGRMETAEMIGEQTGESKNQIRRYIRLTYLIPELLELVDEKRIAFTPAVELSYLTEQEQYDLLETIESEERTPSLSQAQRMKKLSQSGELDMDRIFAIMTEEKANQKEKLSFRVDDIRRFFPKNYTPKDMQAAIMKLVEAECRRRQRMRDDRDAR